MTSSFAPIVDVAELMRAYSLPWFVAGGWAIDLFLERVTRIHGDIEIGVYREDQHALRRHLHDCSLEKAVQTPAGGKWVRWDQDEELRLPTHQILAKRAGEGPKEFEFFLNERTATDWASRRHPGLIRPIGEVVVISFLGIPILTPEIQLLFKAKQTRPKDTDDFHLALPRLSHSQREWLASALRQYHPGHPWIETI